MPSEVKQCSCKGTPGTDFQDKTYGKGMRLMNLSGTGDNATCTCCGVKINLRTGTVIAGAKKK